MRNASGEPSNIAPSKSAKHNMVDHQSKIVLYVKSQAAFFKELIPLKKKKEMLEAMCLDIFIT